MGTTTPHARLEIKGTSVYNFVPSLLIRNSTSDSILAVSDTGIATIGSVSKDFGQLQIINDGKYRDHLILAGTNFANAGRYISGINFTGVNNTDRFWRIATLNYGPDAGSNYGTRNSSMQFQNDSISQVMVLHGDGNVTVGSSALSNRSLFTVDGGFGAVSAMFQDIVPNSNGVAIENNYPGIGFNTYYNSGRKMIGTGYGGLIGVDPNLGDMYFYSTPNSVSTADAAANVTLKMIISKAGNVGIGNSIPTQALDVTGFIHSSGLNGGATSLSVDASGNIIRTPSDARLKYDVKPIDNALEKVLALNGVTYKFIDSTRFGSGRQIGLLAQQLEKIVPEAVSDGGEYKSVNYPALIALMAEALKEEDKKNQELEKRLSILENKLGKKKKISNKK